MVLVSIYANLPGFVVGLCMAALVAIMIDLALFYWFDLRQD